MDYSLKELALLCGGKLCEGSDGERRFDYITSDSRNIRDEKSFFVAFKGDRFDGHAFAADICKMGGAIIDDENFVCPNAILVDNVKAALYRIALYHRQHKLSGVKVLAVTGSVGKTTVKNMAHLVMSVAYNCYKSPGNQNSLMGMPMAILNMSPKYEWAVLELGMSERGEIERLSKLTVPTAAIVTNIGHSHIVALGSREAIRDEKTDVRLGMIEGGAMVLNGDEPLLREKTYENALYCSVADSGCDAFAEDLEELENGTRFTAVVKGEKAKCFLPAFGSHNVQNALLCICAGVACGVELCDAVKALEGFESEGNRQRIYVKDGVKVIADCYNASPESMKAALGVLSESEGTRYAVLGDMLELGDYAERLHRMVGSAAAGRCDRLFCVGRDAAFIADEAVKCGFDPEKVSLFAADEKDAAAEALKSELKAGDSVLFKASNKTYIWKVMEKAGL